MLRCLFFFPYNLYTDVNRYLKIGICTPWHVLCSSMSNSHSMFSCFSHSFSLI